MTPPNSSNDPLLSGRRLVITGASRGLGRAMAIIAADQGAELVLLARDPAKLSGVTDAVKDRTGREATALVCDLGKPEHIQDACSRVLAMDPVVDVLVNNAAPWLSGTLESASEREVVETVAATVAGTILVTKALLPGLRRSTAADIVTIVSTAGLAGQESGEASPVFHAAKHAQAGFHDKLRLELKHEGIRLTAIYPPDFDDTDPLGAEWSEIRGATSQRRLTNREVVAAILFAITAPRVCNYPVIVLDNMWRD